MPLPASLEQTDQVLAGGAEAGAASLNINAVQS